MVICLRTYRARHSTIRPKLQNTKLFQTIEQYKQLRGYYTKNVVAKAKASNMKIHFDHKDVENTLPLPATMIQDLSQLLGESQDGLELKLYSEFPFPNRKERHLDGFATAALAAFKSNPDQPFVPN